MKRILEAPSRRVANIFNEVDTNFIEVCNSMLRIAYPLLTLVNYADPLNEPTIPIEDNAYLIKSDDTELWGTLDVQKNHIIYWSGFSWIILDYKFTEINEGLQDLYFKAENIEYSTNANLTATTTQEAIDELVQILVNVGILGGGGGD